jgi:hypothetical protein
LYFILWPFPVLEGHISHKRFVPPLIAPGDFEDNADKERDEYCEYSRQIRIKSGLIQFESNCRINRRRCAVSWGARAALSAVNVDTAQRNGRWCPAGRSGAARGRDQRRFCVYRLVTLAARKPAAAA